MKFCFNPCRTSWARNHTYFDEDAHNSLSFHPISINLRHDFVNQAASHTRTLMKMLITHSVFTLSPSTFVMTLLTKQHHMCSLKMQCFCQWSFLKRSKQQSWTIPDCISRVWAHPKFTEDTLRAICWGCGDTRILFMRQPFLLNQSYVWLHPHYFQLFN